MPSYYIENESKEKPFMARCKNWFDSWVASIAVFLPSIAAAAAAAMAPPSLRALVPIDVKKKPWKQKLHLPLTDGCRCNWSSSEWRWWTGLGVTLMNIRYLNLSTVSSIFIFFQFQLWIHSMCISFIVIEIGCVCSEDRDEILLKRNKKENFCILICLSILVSSCLGLANRGKNIEIQGWLDWLGFMIYKILTC